MSRGGEDAVGELLHEYEKEEAEVLLLSWSTSSIRRSAAPRTCWTAIAAVVLILGAAGYRFFFNAPLSAVT